MDDDEDRRSRCYTVVVAILLALASALVYGVSDYIGGRTSRRFPPIVVAFTAELALLATVLVLVPTVESSGPTSRAVWWGIVGGFAGSLGVLGLYAALARGNMTVVAPVTGIVAAAVPVAVGFGIGERPGTPATAGIGLALVSVALIGGIVGARHQHVDVRTVVLASAVGAAFGMLFVAYSRTGDDAGLWPLLASRISGTPLLGAAAFWSWRAGRLQHVTRAVLLPGAVIGVLILTANGLYLVAARDGLLSVVAVLVALYPASTVALAALFDHERASRWQIAGMALAVVAVTLITV